jgi:hypothetical protein
MIAWKKSYDISVMSNDKKEGLSNYTRYNSSQIFQNDVTHCCSYSIRDARDEETRTVERRYSDFLWLYTKLQAAYPGATVPPIPGKKMFGKTNRRVVECRQRGLEEFINRIVRHPVLSMAPYVNPFLYEEEVVNAKVVWEQYVGNMDRPVSSSTSRSISWRISSSQKQRDIKVSDLYRHSGLDM